MGCKPEIRFEIIGRNKALRGVLMQRLQLFFWAHQIDPARYCTAPDEFDFDNLELLFVPRTTPDDKTDLVLGEDAGEDEFIIATANPGRSPDDRPSVTSATRSMPFCQLRVDVKQAVLFVNHMIATKL